MDQNHEKKKRVLRTLGPIVLGAGILCVVIAIADFLGAGSRGMGGFGPMSMNMHGPKYFGLFFLGAPLIFVGAIMCNFGYMRDVAKYASKEMAPVAKDTFNYMAAGTKEGVKNIASAIHEGVHGEQQSKGTYICPDCRASNDVDARFCKNCGKGIPQKRYCTRCGTENDRDARFCDSCGNSLDKTIQ